MSLFSKKKIQILVVEDELDIAEGIKARLELEDFEVTLASNGAVGVEMARSQKPDLMIVDVMMPQVNGYEVCKLVRADARTNAIPILVLTALPHLKDAEQAFDAGANDFLNKPYSNDRLIQKIRKLLPAKS
jgi:DNA-binding response OmpR family regulator